MSAESITAKSSTGVRVVNDDAASNGQAIEFSSGANQRTESQPKVYVELRFSAPAGRYIVWLRGKTDINNGYTDSVWYKWTIKSGPEPKVPGWRIGWTPTRSVSMAGQVTQMIPLPSY